MTYVCLTMSAFSRYTPYKRSVGTGEGLARLGNKVYVIALDCDENRKRMREEAPHCQPVWYHGGLVREIVSKLVAIWRIRPDVVLDPSVYSVRHLAFLRCFFPRGTKSIVEFSEWFSVYSEKWTTRLRWKFLETVACLENQYILCASRCLQEAIASKCHKLHLKRSVAYSPYAYPSYLHPMAGVKSEVQYVVYMGGVSRSYGFPCLMAAFAEVAQTGRKVVLDVCGRGSYVGCAEKWLKEKGLLESVRFNGYVPEYELNDHLGRADVFVVPLHDTIHDRARCPSKLFYYLPYSKPIVTCAFGNPHDVLGEHGFYYEADNSKSMAQVLLNALDAAGDFSYPMELLEENTWDARARQMDAWMREGVR